MFKIDTDIPLVPKAHLYQTRYPWRDMPVGGSFFVALPQSSLSGAVTNAAKKTGFKFATRSVVETDENGNNVKGTRIWRIE
jgi:hypothetical protein